MKTLNLILCALFPIFGFCQMDEPVYFDYENQSLEEIFIDLQDRYNLQFSYSRIFVPVDQKVSARSEGLPLKDALEMLFADTEVIFKIIRDRKVLLNVSPDKSRETPSLARAIIAKDNPVPECGKQKPKKKCRKKFTKVDAINIPKPVEIQASGKQAFSSFDLERLTCLDSSMHKREIAQLSIFPNISTNGNDSYVTTHKVSANIFVGMNGGVSGVEVGGLGNIVINDVKGFQLAGVFNQVNGEMRGTQIGGIVNYNKLNTRGVQIAGLANINKNTNAVQSAGLLNFVDGQLSGVQITGGVNIVNGDANALQIALGSNFTLGNTMTQIAGVLNRAENVKKSQISGFANIADKVEGNQVGLVNICNEINGTTFGLINLVKKGYNAIELSGNLVVESGLAVKMGSRRFYNIFQVAKSYRKNAWGLGYGLGTSFGNGPKLSGNVDMLVMHINENEFWTKPRNLMVQTRCQAAYQLHKNWHFFLGPNFSLLSSRIKNPDTGVRGSELPIYHLGNINTNNSNLKMWFGFNAGVRYQL